MFLTLLPSPARARDKWDAVPPADLAAKVSSTSPDADVEILLDRMAVDSDFTYSKVEHSLRVKIYTAKGVEDWGRYRAETAPAAEVKYLSARVIKPDGSMTEMQKGDFHESVLLKFAGEKWKQTSFAFPNLAPGDVIECHWTDVFHAWLYGYNMFFQEKFPVRQFEFRVQNYPTEYWVEWRNCVSAKVDSKEDWQMALLVRNTPALPNEGYLPPEWAYRGGVLLIPNNKHDAPEEWLNLSRSMDSYFMDNSRPSRLKKKALALVAGAATDDEKLRRLYEFCQNEIENLDEPQTPEAKATKAKRIEGQSGSQDASYTLDKHEGWSFEINLLFAGLARATGFEVKRIESASKKEIMDIRNEKGWAFLDRATVAVKAGGNWRYFAPGSYWIPYGMLDERDEGATGLLCDQGAVTYQVMPSSLASDSGIHRQARLTLDPEGTLDGEIEESFSGHNGTALKAANGENSVEETERHFRNELVRRLPTAVVSNQQWTNLHNHEFPVRVKYKVHVPGYAEQAGKRLIVTENYFALGRPEVFTEETRTLPIFFPFAREEHDEVEMILPEGFELDHPSAPADVAAAEKTIGVKYRLAYLPSTRRLTYTRDFVLGGNQAISFQAASYPALKSRFEKIHEMDGHALALKRKAPVAPPASPATAPAAATEK